MQQWRPKLTPYRSFVLFSTIGLGSGKAVATARGLSLVATNIEWISGVLIFSIIYVLGLLERNLPSNRFLSWFFAQDILHYRHRDYQPENLSGPIVTGYRLLTTFSVTLFGVTKAYLMYRNQDPTALNAVDWIAAVIVTSFLYVLGLYEDNPVNLMPYLFFTDCSSLVYAGSWIFIYPAGLSLSFLWTKIAFEMTFIPLLDLRPIYNRILDPADDPYSGKMPLPQPLAMGLSNLSMHFIKTFFFLICFLAGFVIFAYIFVVPFLYVRGFSFIRISLRISLAILSRFHLDTPILWLGNLFHSKLCRFAFKIIVCLIILLVCAIFFAAISYLFLDFSCFYFFPMPFWLMPLYLILGVCIVSYLAFSILAFVVVMVCLYYFVCFLFVLCYSLVSQEIPAIFDPMHKPWSHLNLFDIFT